MAIHANETSNTFALTVPPMSDFKFNIAIWLKLWMKQKYVGFLKKPFGFKI